VGIDALRTARAVKGPEVPEDKIRTLWKWIVRPAEDAALFPTPVPDRDMVVLAIGVVANRLGLRRREVAVLEGRQVVE